MTFVAEDAPDVPRGFVARHEAAEALRSRIAGGAGPGPPVVGLYGPAGAGKTTLVASVARELAAEAADRGCVLWLNLGDTPGPPDGLLRAIQVIERHDGRPPSRRDTLDPIEEMEEYLAWLEDPECPRDKPDLSDDLRAWLSERACLMVLDDVSRAEEARPLLVGAAGCPTVLIARDAKVAEDLAVPGVRLDAMDPGQSLALIEARVGSRLDPGARESALELAEAVGGLPLALDVLCAASSSLEVPWPALRDGVLAEASSRRAPEEEPAGRAAGRPIGLRGVVGWVLGRLPADLREAFAWLGVFPAGATVSPELAGWLWGVDERAAVTRLHRLAGAGLIASGGSAGRASYRLHEPMRAVAWDLATAPAGLATPDGLPGLGLSTSEAHAERFARLCAGGTAATGLAAAAAAPLSDHLPRHLEDVRPPEDVDEVLGQETPDGDNAWYLAREHQGDRPGYLEDVDRAWRRADAAALAGGGPGPVARQCRYALIRASVAPEWPDPPAGLIALLVESGRWSTRRAEVAVRRIRHGWTRKSAWTALAPHLEGSAREDAVRTALEEARKQGKPEDQARALAEVLPVLSPARRDAVLHEAVGLVRQAMLREPPSSPWPQRTLVALVPHLDDPERTDLLRLLAASPDSLDGSDLVELMTDLAASLQPDGYQDAVRLVLDGYRGRLSFVQRARILLPLGPPGDLGSYRDGLRQALDDARDRLRRSVEQSEMVSAFYRKHGLGSHINCVPVNYLGFFSDLCSLLAGPDLADLREEALAIARGAASDHRDSAPISTVREVPEPGVAGAQRVERAPAPVRRVRGRRSFRARGRTRGESDNRFRSLAVLVPVMGPDRASELAAEALGAFRELRYGGFGNDQFLYSLLPFLEGPERREAWRKALRDVRSSGYGGPWRVPTAAVLGTLDEDELGELMDTLGDAEAGNRIREPSVRPWLDVLPFLSELRRREFLRSYPSIDDEVSRVAVLRAAFPYLGVSLRPGWSAELIEAARSLQSTPLRVALLADLLPHLDGSDREIVLAEVLDAVRRMGEWGDRVGFVRKLAEHLDATERGVALADLLEAARAPGHVDDPYRNIELIEVFAALAPGLDWASRPAPLLEALDKVRAEAGRSNPDFHIQLASTLAALGPCLAGPNLEDVRREALSIARSLGSSTPQAGAVIALLLAPCGAGQPGRLEEVSRAARGIDSKGGRFRTLAKGAERLDGEARAAVAREVLEVAWSISEAERHSHWLDMDERVEALTAVVPLLDGADRDDLAHELVEEVRALQDDRWRTLAAKKLLPYLDEDRRRDLLRDAHRTAFQSGDGRARFESLKLIASALTVGELVDALARAGRERDGYRCEAMEVIARALAVMPPDVLRPLWRDWLRERAPAKRPELCRDLAAMMPVVAALGGPEAVMGLARAVRDVGRWWP